MNLPRNSRPSMPGSIRAALRLTSHAVWKHMSATWFWIAAHTPAPGLSAGDAAGANESGAVRNGG